MKMMTATEAHQKDIRMRRMIETIAHETASECEKIAPNADLETLAMIYEVAFSAAAKMYAMIYAEDGELAAQKQMTEAFRKIAEESLLNRGPQTMILESGKNV